MKKAFTLIELLAVIILLGVIGLVAVPSVTKLLQENQDKIYDAQIQELKEITEKWAYRNLDLLPVDENGSVTLTLLDLKKSGLVELDLRNPKTKELFPNDMKIIVSFINKKYVYEVYGDSGTNITNEFNVNAPTIVLNGNSIEYTELNSEYIELGATSKDKDNNNVTVNIQYKYNDTEIPSITTNELKTFIVVYSATANGYTSYIVRTVVVRDTTPPDLVIAEDVTLTSYEATSFNLLAGATATDNSGEVITVRTSGYDTLFGKHIVSYKACDSNNNCTTKKRIVNISPTTVTITNLIENGNFEQGINGWVNYTNIVLSLGDSGYIGQKSICATNIDSTQFEGYFRQGNTIKYISGHKYYSQVYVKSESVYTQTYFPVTPPYPSTYFSPGNGWRMDSLYVSNPDIVTGNYYYRLDLNNNKTVASACYDAILLVDLTDAFGADKEPTKEWCNNNIKYFEGTTVTSY